MADPLPDLVPRFTDATTAAAAAALDGTLRWWTDAWRRPAPGFDLLRWTQLVADRRAPRWAHANEVVLETPIARLRDFSLPGADAVIPTLVLPPQAGHDSCTVDFPRRQSQSTGLRDACLRNLYTLDWIGATGPTRNAGIEDYVAVVDAAV